MKREEARQVRSATNNAQRTVDREIRDEEKLREGKLREEKLRQEKLRAMETRRAEKERREQTVRELGTNGVTLVADTKAHPAESEDEEDIWLV